jgi:flagellar motility protein MotE (MotC chaperone)
MGKLSRMLFEDGPKTDAPKSSPTFGTPQFGVGAIAPSVQGPRFGTTADPAMIAEVESALSQRSSSVYLKFTSLLASLASKLPDEASRFAAAFAVAPNMGLSPEAVVSAYGERVGTLQTLRQQFEAQSRDTLNQRVQGTQQEADKAAAELDRTNQDIATLTAKAELLRKTRDDKLAQINHDREEITATSTKMVAAFEAIRIKVAAESETMSRYIRGS